MPFSLCRVIATLLVSCLLSDTVSAGSIMPLSAESLVAGGRPSAQSALYASQAFISRLHWVSPLRFFRHAPTDRTDVARAALHRPPFQYAYATRTNSSEVYREATLAQALADDKGESGEGWLVGDGPEAKFIRPSQRLLARIPETVTYQSECDVAVGGRTYHLTFQRYALGAHWDLQSITDGLHTEKYNFGVYQRTNSAITNLGGGSWLKNRVWKKWFGWLETAISLYAPMLLSGPGLPYIDFNSGAIVLAVGFIYWAPHAIRAFQEKDWSVMKRGEILILTVAHMAVALAIPYHGITSALFTVEALLLAAAHTAANWQIERIEARLPKTALGEVLTIPRRWSLFALASTAAFSMADAAGQRTTPQLATVLVPKKLLEKGFRVTLHTRVPGVIVVEARLAPRAGSSSSPEGFGEGLELNRDALWSGLHIMKFPGGRTLDLPDQEPIRLVFQFTPLFGGANGIQKLQVDGSGPIGLMSPTSHSFTGGRRHFIRSLVGKNGLGLTAIMPFALWPSQIPDGDSIGIWIPLVVAVAILGITYLWVARTLTLPEREKIKHEFARVWLFRAIAKRKPEIAGKGRPDDPAQAEIAIVYAALLIRLARNMKYDNSLSFNLAEAIEWRTAHQLERVPLYWLGEEEELFLKAKLRDSLFDDRYRRSLSELFSDIKPSHLEQPYKLLGIALALGWGRILYSLSAHSVGAAYFSDGAPAFDQMGTVGLAALLMGGAGAYSLILLYRMLSRSGYPPPFAARGKSLLAAIGFKPIMQPSPEGAWALYQAPLSDKLRRLIYHPSLYKHQVERQVSVELSDPLERRVAGEPLFRLEKNSVASHVFEVRAGYAVSLNLKSGDPVIFSLHRDKDRLFATDPKAKLGPQPFPAVFVSLDELTPAELNRLNTEATRTVTAEAEALIEAMAAWTPERSHFLVEQTLNGVPSGLFRIEKSRWQNILARAAQINFSISFALIGLIAPAHSVTFAPRARPAGPPLAAAA